MRRTEALFSFILRARSAAPFAAVLLPTLAHAEPARVEQKQHVVFDDDLLNADLAAPFGAQVFGTHIPPARTRLIRPRTNFLAQLYKSVEQL